MDQAGLFVTCPHDLRDLNDDHHDYPRETVGGSYISHSEDGNRATTPVGDDMMVRFGLPVRSSYRFGRGEGVDFHLADQREGAHKRVSALHFILHFNAHGVWMLTDCSRNATQVDGLLVASDHARRCAERRGVGFTSQYVRAALHPQRSTVVKAGAVEMYIEYGARDPEPFVDGGLPTDFSARLNRAHIEGSIVTGGSTTTTTAAAAAAAAVGRPAKLQPSRYYVLEQWPSDTDTAPTVQSVIDRASGERVYAARYGPRIEKTGRDRFRDLSEVVNANPKAMLRLLREDVDMDEYVVVSELWLDAWTLKGWMALHIVANSEWDFILIQVLDAVVFLHRHGWVLTRISVDSIYVKGAWPVVARLGGFEHAVRVRSAPRTDASHDDSDVDGAFAADVQAIVDLMGFLSCDEVSPLHSLIRASDRSLFDAHNRLGRCTQGLLSWPFQAVVVARTFPITWKTDGHEKLVLASDVHRIVRALRRTGSELEMPPNLNTYIREVDGTARRFYTLKYVRLLFSANDCPNVIEQLSRMTTSHTITCDIRIPVTSSLKMVNVSKFLQLVDPATSRVALQVLRPQLQQVQGDLYWSGFYIDRASFLKLYEYVRDEASLELESRFIDSFEESVPDPIRDVDFSSSIVVPSRRSVDPWFLLRREDHTAIADVLTWDELKDKLHEADLVATYDRLVEDFAATPRTSLGWTKTYSVDTPPADEDKTSVATSSDSDHGKFRFRRKARTRRVPPTLDPRRGFDG